jgi:hypothetical protein
LVEGGVLGVEIEPGPFSDPQVLKSTDQIEASHPVELAIPSRVQATIFLEDESLDLRYS